MKAILAIAAAAVLAVGTLSAPTTAEARCRGCAPAIIGGAVLGGLLLGGAIANSGPRYYGPEPGYVVYDGYRSRHPSDCYGGYWARRPLRDGYGNVVGWSRPRFVCP